MVDRTAILRSRDTIRDLFDNVLRMMDDVEARKVGHSCATVELTCNALASAMTTAIIDTDVVKSAYRQKLAPRDPRSVPMVPRYRDADLPAVASVGSL